MSRNLLLMRIGFLLVGFALGGRVPLLAQEPPAKPPAEENASKPAQEEKAGKDSTEEKKKEAKSKEPPSVSGTWHDADGREYNFTQKPSKKGIPNVTLRTSTGQEFKGNLEGRTLKLAHELTPQSINRKLPEWAKRELLFKLQVKIEGTLSEDGEHIEANFIDYDIEGDSEVSKITDRREVKKPLRLSLSKAVIYDVQVLEDQSREEYPFKKESSSEAISFRTLFVVGKNFPKAGEELPGIFSADEKIEYKIRAQATDTEHDKEFQKGWEKATAGMSAEQAQALKKQDSLLVAVTLHKDVKPGPQAVSISGGRGEWLLGFGGTIAHFNFLRQTGENEFERPETVYLPEKLIVELRFDQDIPLEDVPLTFMLNGHQGMFAGDPPVARGAKGSTRIYRTESFQIVPRGESDSNSNTKLPNLGARDGEKLTARLENLGMFGTDPLAAMALVGDSPSQLWRIALRNAAVCNGKSVDDQSLNDLAKTAESPVRGIDIRIGDHGAMLLLRDEFVRMMQSEAKNLAEIKNNVGLLYGFRDLLFTMKRDGSSPWSRVMVTGPAGDQTLLSNAFDSQFLAANFKNPRSANEWSFKAVREGIDNFRNSITAGITEAQGGGDCEVEKLLLLTGIGYDAVIARVTPQLVKKEQGEWVPDKVARGWVNGLQTTARAVKAQKDYTNLKWKAAFEFAAALVPIAGQAMYGAIAAHVLTGAFIVAGAGIEAVDQLEIRRTIDKALGASAVLGTGRLTEAELEKQPWGNIVKSALLQAGLYAGGVVAMDKLEKMASAADGAMAATRVLRGTPLGQLSKEELESFVSLVMRAKTVELEQGIEALTVGQRRAVMALDRLGEDATQLTAAAGRPGLPNLGPQDSEANAASAKPGQPTGGNGEASAARAPPESQPEFTKPTNPEPAREPGIEPAKPGNPERAPNSEPEPAKPSNPEPGPKPGPEKGNPRNPEPAPKPRPEPPNPSKPEPTETPKARTPEGAPVQPEPTETPKTRTPEGAPVQPEPAEAPKTRTPEGAPVQPEPAETPKTRTPERPPVEPAAGETPRTRTPDKPTPRPESAETPKPRTQDLGDVETVRDAAAKTRTADAPRTNVEAAQTPKTLTPDRTPDLADLNAKRGQAPVRAEPLPPEADVERALAGLPAEGARGPPPPSSVAKPLTGLDVRAYAKVLEGATVQLPRGQLGTELGPIKLGKGLGEPGYFGALYPIDGHSEWAVKIIHNAGPEGSESIARQFAGWEVIKGNPNVPAPKIIDYFPGGEKETSYLIVENLHAGDWEAKNVTLYDRSTYSERHRNAVHELYNNIGANGDIWLDGHARNVFFFEDAAGNLKAGVLDHDMLCRASELSIQTQGFKERGTLSLKGKPIVTPFMKAAQNKDVALDAKQFMEALFQSKFPAP